VLTRDVAAAQAFYTELFGWSSETSDIGGDSYTLLKVGDEPRARLMGIRPEWGEMPPHWITYFASADCDADARAAEELGGRTLTGPQDIPGAGRFAALADPQGASFSILAST
jgi:uncharacterized protein